MGGAPAFTKGRAYSTLEPGPYWPDTGQAHTTCKAWLVASVIAVSFRPTRVCSNGGKESAGMTSRPSRLEDAKAGFGPIKVDSGSWIVERSRTVRQVAPAMEKREMSSKASKAV
jgi:hypothetical protein